MSHHHVAIVFDNVWFDVAAGMKHLGWWTDNFAGNGGIGYMIYKYATTIQVFCSMYLLLLDVLHLDHL